MKQAPTLRWRECYRLVFVTPLMAAISFGSEAAAAEAKEHGFRLGAPKTTLAVRAGFLYASADSDLYDFTTDQLTLERRDFDAPTIGIELARRLRPRLDLVVGVDYAESDASSEFRDFVDQDNRPIEQDTRLKQTGITLSGRYYLTPRGRTVGSYAWIPNRLTPYVGGGLGILRYRFAQEGDFVDFEDLSIFRDRFQSSDWTTSSHAFIGLDIKIELDLRLSIEARYTWAEATLEDDFLGFEPLDLSGLRTAAAVHFLF